MPQYVVGFDVGGTRIKSGGGSPGGRLLKPSTLPSGFTLGPQRLTKELGEKPLAPFDIDLALLPINGRKPERRVSGNLWGKGAAGLARRIAAKAVIPCHYEMFEFNTAAPDEFVAECKTLGQTYAVLRCGERWDSPPSPS